jgi:hypothetical protein
MLIEFQECEGGTSLFYASLTHCSSNELISFPSTPNSSLGLQVKPLSDPPLSRSRGLKSGPSSFKAGEVGEAIAGGV